MRIHNEYGVPLEDIKVATPGNPTFASPGMKNEYGFPRKMDIYYPTKDFINGATDNFVETKSGVAKWTDQVATEASADAMNLRNMNADVAGIRYAGQGLRVLGGVAVGYDAVSSGMTAYGQYMGGD